MIPVLYSDGPLWLVGIAWNADVVAAFLAWWMPLNLFTYLFLLAIAKPVFGVKGFKPEVFYIRRLLSSLFVTLPVIAYGLVMVVFDVIFLEPRRKRQMERNRKAYMKDHGLEECS